VRYYAVKKGHTVGVFDNWTDCSTSINGFSGAEYKAFNSEAEAEAYLNDKDLWGEIVTADNEKGYLVAFCDGSFEKELNRYSFGVLLIDTDGRESSLCGFGSNEKYISSNNIIGEIFGVINALDWAISNGYAKIKIYHDYEGLSKWVSGEWKANSEVAKMFLSIYRTKFEGVLEDIQFEKVKGHSNNKYNDKADLLAKSALQDKTKMAIQGDHWFVLPFFSESDFNAIVDLVKEENGNINIESKAYPTKTIHKFELGKSKVVVTRFNTKNQKVLVQGENSTLFQMIISIIVELDGNVKLEPILSSAYRTTIDSKSVDNSFNAVCPSFPIDYPDSIKRLVRQAIINLNYYVESEDYTQYAFPALKALEGHIKYLIKMAGGTVNKNFTNFGRDQTTGEYYLSQTISDGTKKAQIEKCYNYYHDQRHTAFHFGDIIGATDNTRLIDTKVEADEIIQKCIALICEQ
jgi:Predicted double-stranded RNA/RNA-DNA hybrid binding protein